MLDLLAHWADLPLVTETPERAVRRYRKLIEQHAVDSETALENLADEKVPPETPEDLVTQRRDLEKALKEWMTRVRGTDKD